MQTMGNPFSRIPVLTEKGHRRMKTHLLWSARSSVLSSCLALAATVCSRGADSRQDSTPPAQTAMVPNPDAPIMLRGTVVSATANEVVLKSDTGVVTVKLAQPFNVYARVPSDLAHVKETSFIGVTTIKQPDGSERATEIHVFPEELRGLGEGSRMMAPDTSGTANRMTNGNVSASRMSNGSVSSATSTALVVQYPGGSQNVTVPRNTPVTEFRIASKALAAGDKVAVLAKKAADGSLTADKALSTAK